MCLVMRVLSVELTEFILSLENHVIDLATSPNGGMGTLFEHCSNQEILKRIHIYTKAPPPHFVLKLSIITAYYS